ncbi:Fe-only nitrogenase accessory AnfO family protein [Anaerosacchariphilus polymeriproducens]|uniref:Fe-only nitrogenase accessory protein AnfO n=1 Tax=Anaerosacchariphilus polymeriproducens TaxID=1812858 RepID=A0A371AUB9_9FIRM|nr:Fe-only nitrogenase accessory AnfO family protein [Anaerosacchariphilus polymeriproducens]RDU23139.1 hypothetical protein DWV06_12330 [Anaerosacchariphilus polymeriproducens]
MSNKVAILKDKNENITDIYNLSKIDIYERNTIWKISYTIDDIEPIMTNLITIRIFLEQIMKQLKDCKIIVGKTIVGIPFHILDRNGYVLCESEAFSIKLLDQLYFDYCLEGKKDNIQESKYVPGVPQPFDHDGNYFFDFIEVQKYRPEITSKKALIPFLSNELFKTLTIQCSHIMPWLESFLNLKKYQFKIKREQGKYLIVIFSDKL